jgi:transposase-like protein
MKIMNLSELPVAEILKFLMYGVVAVVVKETVSYVRNLRTDKANAKKILAEANVSDSSSLTVSDNLLRQWMRDASEAAKEISTLRKELTDSQIAFGRAKVKIERLGEILLEAVEIIENQCGDKHKHFADEMREELRDI